MDQFASQELLPVSGVPQLTAISECSKATKDAGVTLIADGGIRNSGDITKALVAGADSVMVGSLLAGTDESPGEIVYRGNYRYKVTRGMASMSARKTSCRGGETCGWTSVRKISKSRNLI